MASKKGKETIMSHTAAPPADAPSLDVANLDKQFKSMEVSKKTAPGLLTSRGFDSSHKPSSSSSKSSSTIRHSEHMPHVSSSSSRQTRRGQSTIRQLNSQASVSSRHATGNSSHPRDNKSHISSSHHTSSPKTTQQTITGGTARVKTEHYKVGNMERTFLEGMVPTTQYTSSSSTHKTNPANTRTSHIATRSFARSNTRTILIDPEDRAMADRQTKYATLAPSEQAKQEVWAQSMIERTGSCPEGFSWRRIEDGYQCEGGHHVISDQLLCEGLGGVYAVPEPSRPHQRWGPFYAEPHNPAVFHYRGPEPMPADCPPTLGAGMGFLRTGTMGSVTHGNKTVNVHGAGLNVSRMGPRWTMTGSSRLHYFTGGVPRVGPPSRYPPGHVGSVLHGPIQHGFGHHGPSHRGGTGFGGRTGI